MTKPTLTNPCDLYGICIVFIFYFYLLFLCFRLAAGGGDIMVYSLLATIGASLMSLGLLANNRGKINLIQESLTNSRIEHEENKSITSSFLPTEQKAHGFENGEHKIIIFVTCGILLFLVTLGSCLLFWGYCGFGCIKYKRTREQDFYREQFYANLCQVNNGAQVIEMTSRQ